MCGNPPVLITILWKEKYSSEKLRWSWFENKRQWFSRKDCCHHLLVFSLWAGESSVVVGAETAAYKVIFWFSRTWVRSGNGVLPKNSRWLWWVATWETHSSGRQKVGFNWSRSLFPALPRRFFPVLCSASVGTSGYTPQPGRFTNHVSSGPQFLTTQHYFSVSCCLCNYLAPFRLFSYSEPPREEQKAFLWATDHRLTERKHWHDYYQRPQTSDTLECGE